MHFILVAYDFNREKRAQWRHFLSAFPGATSVIVENSPKNPPIGKNVVQGTNTQYEFSGYAEGMEASSWQAEDLYWVILNDTIFSHHWKFGWKYLITRLRYQSDGIYGDFRSEPITWDGRPLHIFASWIFLLKGQNARIQFQTILKEVLLSFQDPLSFPGYEEYQDRYLQATYFGGYTKILNPEDRQQALRIKKQSIQTEHRLGRKLDDLGWVRPLPVRLYRVVHLMDRWLSFKRRASNLLQSKW